MGLAVNIRVSRALPLLVLLAACSPTNEVAQTTAPPSIATTTSTTTTTQAVVAEPTPAEQQYEADVVLINQLWRNQKLSWSDGFDSGVQFWVDNNYPDLECTYDDYMRSHFPGGPVAGLEIERIADTPTIQPDEGWVVPGGRVEGLPAKGRVYVMEIDSSRTTPETGTVPSEVRSVHVTILDGNAHFFFGCP